MLIQDQPSDYGLFAISPDSAQSIQFPLKAIDYSINICDGLAEVNQLHIYHNCTNQFMEVQYRLPVNPNSCLYRFIATFGTRILQGVIKDKEEAKQEYISSVNKGKMAAYGQINEQTKDVMTIKIGNIPPSTDVKIQIRSIQELKITLNTFYTFDLYLKYLPKFLRSASYKDHVSQGKKINWNFTVSIQSNRKINVYKSTTHPMQIQAFNDNLTSVTLNLNQVLQKDFNFIYSTEDFQLPSFTVGRTDTNTTVMVSFIPKFCQLNLEDAQSAALANKQLQVDIDSVKGQYFFLLDRSGSMSGAPIEAAKKALTLFLRSLPIDSYFNVVSFGSGSSTLFDKSVKNSNQSIKHSVEIISKMSADMGGTNIEQPLKNIFDASVIQGYPKQIFVLTDGEVQDPDRIVELVRRKVKYSRVHTIGFGPYASRKIIEGCAQYGKGSFVNIANGQDPCQKIINLLQDCLTAVISKIELSFDEDLVESIVPNPYSIPYILKNQIASFFITFKGQLNKQTQVSLSYVDPLNQLPYQSYAIIDPQSQSIPFVEKMGHFKIIQQLEDSLQDGKNVDDRIFYVKEIDRKKQIIDLSIEHQILSKFTSFICVEKELIDGRYQEILERGTKKLNIKQGNNGANNIQANNTQLYAPPQYFAGVGCGKGGKGVGGKGKVGTKRTMQKRHTRCSITGITKGDIRRLARKGGVARISSFVYDDARVAIKGFLEHVVKNSIIYSDYARRKTVTAMDVIYALKKINHPLYLGCEVDRKYNKMPNSQSNQNGKGKTKKISKKAVLVQPINTIAQSHNHPFIPFSAEHQPINISIPVPSALIQNVIAFQKMEGFWDDIDLLGSLVDPSLVSEVRKQTQMDIVITLLVIRWIQTNHNLPKYSLLLKKARSWLQRQPGHLQFSKKYERSLK